MSINLNSFYNHFLQTRQDVSSGFKLLFSKTVIRILVILMLGANAFTWLFAYFVRTSTKEDQLVLHYNVDFGINLIDSASRMVNIPLIGLIIVIVNLLILLFFHRIKEIKFLAFLLSMAAIFCNLLLLFAITSIYLINFT